VVDFLFVVYMQLNVYRTFFAISYTELHFTRYWDVISGDLSNSAFFRRG